MEIEKFKEIKKALECCVIHDCSDSCIFSEKHPFACLTEMHKQLLTLINELESENERLAERHKHFANLSSALEKDLENASNKVSELELENDLLREECTNLNGQLMNKTRSDFVNEQKKMKKAFDKVSKAAVDKFANEVYKELYRLGKIYALPETLDADKYGIFSLTQEVVSKIAKQFAVEIKE